MTLSPALILLLVPSFALAAFMVLGLYPYTLRRRQVHIIALLGGGLPLLLMAPLTALCAAGHCLGVVPIFTLTVGQSVVALALSLDPLGATIGLTVSAIGAAVLVYSITYMAATSLADLRRFFALMNLFLAAMLTMVLAGDSIVFFLGWELMGLCSYFLIAYNTTSAESITAGRKAFIMTRVADAYLLAALLLLFLHANSVRLDVLIPASATLDATMTTVIAALLLGGAMGKSAQVPFHTWLPSAMAGPTPVSALLHSATMVAAGAFLLMRFAPLMQLAPMVQVAAAVLGVATAAYGAMSALFQQDVKRLLAYSSISQIGFMMLSLGVGAPEAAAAHFVMHAIFKSLLFLAAGDITHGCVEGTDLSSMRGAWTRKPVSYVAFVAGGASLAGLPMVTAGWWSKEAILTAVQGFGAIGQVLWLGAVLTALLTGAYASRAIMIGLMPMRETDMPNAGNVHRHEAPRTGTIWTNLPLMLLATGAIVAGVLVTPIMHFLGAEEPHASAFSVYVAAAAPLLGVGLALALVFVPWLSEGLRNVRAISRKARKMPRRGEGGANSRFVRLALWLNWGMRFDGLYQVMFVRPFVKGVRWLNGYGKAPADPVGTWPVLALVWLQQKITAPLAPDWFDKLWMRGGAGVVRLWALARTVQTGRVRDYGFAMAGGIAGLLLLVWGTP